MAIQAPWDKPVRAGDLRRPLSRLEGGDEVPDEFISNGNTLVPDNYSKLHPRFADTTAAGIVHDWDFHVGGGFRDFHAANKRYYRNLRRLRFNPVMAFARTTAVSTFGVFFFNWKG
jgi:hypothetical protein